MVWLKFHWKKYQILFSFLATIKHNNSQSLGGLLSLKSFDASIVVFEVLKPYFCQVREGKDVPVVPGLGETCRFEVIWWWFYKSVLPVILKLYKPSVSALEFCSFWSSSPDIPIYISTCILSSGGNHGLSSRKKKGINSAWIVLKLVVFLFI